MNQCDERDLICEEQRNECGQHREKKIRGLLNTPSDEVRLLLFRMSHSPLTKISCYIRAWQGDFSSSLTKDSSETGVAAENFSQRQLEVLAHGATHTKTKTVQLSHIRGQWFGEHGR